MDDCSPTDLATIERICRKHAARYLGDWQELLGAAWQGFQEAQRRYDASKGVKFWTFAYSNVNGRIKDYQRSMLPASMRRSRSAARRKREAMGLSIHPAQLDEEMFDAPDSRETSMFGVLLDESVDGLPFSEDWKVMVRMRIDGQSMKAIARRFSLSESRVSQLFTRMQSYLQEIDGSDRGIPLGNFRKRKDSDDMDSSVVAVDRDFLPDKESLSPAQREAEQFVEFDIGECEMVGAQIAVILSHGNFEAAHDRIDRAEREFKDIGKSEDVRDWPLLEVLRDVRTVNAVEEAFEVLFVGEFLDRVTPELLSDVPNVGRVTLTAIANNFANIGIDWGREYATLLPEINEEDEVTSTQNNVLDDVLDAIDSLAGLDLESIDAEIEKKEKELERIRRARKLVAAFADGSGNGRRPVSKSQSRSTNGRAAPKLPMPKRIEALLMQHGELTLSQITSKLSSKAGPVSISLRRSPLFVEKGDAWTLVANG